VVVADLVGDGAEAVAEGIRAGGADAVASHVDNADEDSVVAMIDLAVREFGRLDVLHNNAAATGLTVADVPFEDADPEVWAASLRTNVIGTMLGIKHAVPHMRQVGCGSIINTASNAGLHGDSNPPAYGASKAAIISITQYAATMYGKESIRVNAISPGLILNAERAGMMPPAFLKLMLDSKLTPRLGMPEDIANAAVYLGSDESTFVTGLVLRVDGGALAAPGYRAGLEALGGWGGLMGSAAGDSG
jgi:NAD(P)-dependent dehydrogenase (short-subunit alcohol dehydrogenase family)